jgi:hypothetical protein
VTHLVPLDGTTPVSLSLPDPSIQPLHWACRQCGGDRWTIVSIGMVAVSICVSCKADRRFIIEKPKPYDAQQGKSA